jgi:serine/threonine protein phosphatase PrpC
MNFSIHQASHIGNRKFNQDRVAYAYHNETLLLVLADGMGGHLHGERAAELAIETFIEAFAQYSATLLDEPQVFLSNTMRAAHERILALDYDKMRGESPGTTCVVALIQDGKLYFGHAGDSRLYVLRDQRVLSKTDDHSLVSHWVQWGLISLQEARSHPRRNQITNCLGGAENVFFMETGEPLSLHPGDVLLLGSDGLWSPFLDEEIAQAFVGDMIDHALDQLIATALEREKGHSDNATGLVVRWGKTHPVHHTNKPISHVLEIP